MFTTCMLIKKMHVKAVTCDALHCCGNSTRAASAALHDGYLLCVYLRPVSHAVRAHAGVDTITRDASPLAAHTADTVAPHGARARSPV